MSQAKEALKVCKPIKVAIRGFAMGEGEPLVVMSGPCVIESEEHTMRAAEKLKKLFDGSKLNLIFKSSYDKANRSAGSSFRGPGLDEGLRILQRVRAEFSLPVITDVHTVEEAKAAGQVCDVIQIPAFLCRQTDLVIAAGETGAAVNVKKGQFMAPWDMKNVLDKLRSTGNEKCILTDRGTSFGYNNLVSDMRAIPIMSQWGYPVCFDASHSVQFPGGHGDRSGGDRRFIPVLIKAAIAVGAHSIFVESHPDPKNAKSDADSVLSFDDIPALIIAMERLYEVTQELKSIGALAG